MIGQGVEIMRHKTTPGCIIIIIGTALLYTLYTKSGCNRKRCFYLEKNSKATTLYTEPVVIGAHYTQVSTCSLRQ